MQFDLFTPFKRARIPKPETFCFDSRHVPVHFVRTSRARRYVLRVQRDGTIRVTIPRGGSIAYGVEFLKRNTEWLTQQLRRRTLEQAVRSSPWGPGTRFLFQGQSVCLEVREESGMRVVRFADHALTVPEGTADLRPAIERYLWSLAAKELPPLVWRAAAEHRLTVARVTVRGQRSRWGSCSPRGTISLNWRLIQAPPSVRDYLIIHELMHLRQMNHSARFWSEVGAICPDYTAAEDWLNAHAHLLR